jgi:hypothetical protein
MFAAIVLGSLGVWWESDVAADFELSARYFDPAENTRVSDGGTRRPGQQRAESRNA